MLCIFKHHSSYFLFFFTLEYNFYSNKRLMHFSLIQLDIENNLSWWVMMSLGFHKLSNALYRRNIRKCWICHLIRLLFFGTWYFWELNSSLVINLKKVPCQLSNNKLICYTQCQCGKNISCFNKYQQLFRICGISPPKK